MNRESQEYKTQEVIAELTSCVLAQIYGFDKRTYSMQYIKSYMDTDQKVGSEILKVIGTVQKILDNIFSMRREDA
jgi:antirestriction protein ArdC